MRGEEPRMQLRMSSYAIMQSYPCTESHICQQSLPCKASRPRIPGITLCLTINRQGANMQCNQVQTINSGGCIRRPSSHHYDRQSATDAYPASYPDQEACQQGLLHTLLHSEYTTARSQSMSRFLSSAEPWRGQRSDMIRVSVSSNLRCTKRK